MNIDGYPQMCMFTHRDREIIIVKNNHRDSSTANRAENPGQCKFSTAGLLNHMLPRHGQIKRYSQPETCFHTEWSLHCWKRRQVCSSCITSSQIYLLQLIIATILPCDQCYAIIPINEHCCNILCCWHLQFLLRSVYFFVFLLTEMWTTNVFHGF
jgi:hypothetical protein